MKKTKLLVLGSLMACMSALFQIVPVFLSEAFVIVTIFSAVPIFLISFIHPKTGFAVYLASFMLISFFSVHEALLFLFTNGPVGLSLGSCSHYTARKLIAISISSVILTCCLGILNYLIGIPVFGVALPGSIWIQFMIIIAFSFIFNFIFFKLCRIILKRTSGFLINLGHTEQF